MKKKRARTYSYFVRFDEHCIHLGVDDARIPFCPQIALKLGYDAAACGYLDQIGADWLSDMSNYCGVEDEYVGVEYDHYVDEDSHCDSGEGGYRNVGTGHCNVEECRCDDEVRCNDEIRCNVEVHCNAEVHHNAEVQYNVEVHYNAEAHYNGEVHCNVEVCCDVGGVRCNVQGGHCTVEDDHYHIENDGKEFDDLRYCCLTYQDS